MKYFLQPKLIYSLFPVSNLLLRYTTSKRETSTKKPRKPRDFKLYIPYAL